MSEAVNGSGGLLGQLTVSSAGKGRVTVALNEFPSDEAPEGPGYSYTTTGAAETLRLAWVIARRALAGGSE
jgi:hypothetical protein